MGGDGLQLPLVLLDGLLHGEDLGAQAVDVLVLPEVWEHAPLRDDEGLGQVAGAEGGGLPGRAFGAGPEKVGLVSRRGSKCTTVYPEKKA